MTPRLLPSRLKEPGHRRADARGLGDDVTIEKIIATVLDEAHGRQVEELMDTLQEGLEGLYKRPPYSPGVRAQSPHLGTPFGFQVCLTVGSLARLPYN